MNIKELQERISKTMETKLGLVGSHALSSDNFCTINPRTKERINLQPWDVIHRLSNGEVVNYRAATQDDFKDLLTALDNTKRPFIGEVYDTEIKKNRDMLNALDVKRITDRLINDRLPTYENPPPPPPKKETPEPYTYEVKDHILEDCGGWDDLFENSIDDLHKKYKLLMSGYNSLSKKERESEDGLKRWKKLNELSDRIIELDNNFQDFRKGDKNFIDRFKKYFNAESLHHALVFGSIVFGLKMIEMNWSFIIGYINSIPIEGVYLMTMVFILSKTMIRMPKTYESGPK